MNHETDDEEEFKWPDECPNPLKMNDVRPGMVLVSDGAGGCMRPGGKYKVERNGDDGSLFVKCDVGRHYLHSDDPADDGVLVGFRLPLNLIEDGPLSGLACGLATTPGEVDRRLGLILHVLSKVPNNQTFNIRAWVGVNLVDDHCKTAMCVIGWTAMSKEGNDSGLFLARKDAEWPGPGREQRFTRNDPPPSSWADVRPALFGQHGELIAVGWDAVVSWTGLSYNECTFLFGSASYDEVKEVVDAVRFQEGLRNLSLYGLDLLKNEHDFKRSPLVADVTLAAVRRRVTRFREALRMYGRSGVSIIEKTLELEPPASVHWSGLTKPEAEGEDR